MDTRFKKADYMNKALPLELRLNDLLSKMTLEEKVRQMDMYSGSLFVDKMSVISRTSVAPDSKFVKEKALGIVGNIGIGCIHDLYPCDSVLSNTIQEFVINNSRLGIPVLFSEEALHGLSSPGNTIFPQAIAMASTWNEELAEAVGNSIAAETRSKGIHLVFNPVLGIAREPRWGRVEETLGEDPCLASRLGLSVVKGLQGKSLASNDSVVAEPKHFAVHSIPSGGLNCMACSTGERQMRTDFLPVFKKAVVEGKAMSIMCAYHAIDGIPCASNRWLLTDVLRNEWGFKGFVCSDLGAIKRLFTIHHVADSMEDAIKQAIEAGMDMQFFDFENEFFQSAIIEMVKNNVLPEKYINRAALCILRVKFMLGLFDQPFIEPELSKKVTRCQEHLNISLETARQGVCLLKNKGDLLPLSNKIKKIAVVGPNADSNALGDYTPPVQGFSAVTLLKGIQNIVDKSVTVTYEKGCSIREIDMDSVKSEYLLTPDKTSNGLKGEYYNNVFMTEKPDLVRIDQTVDFNFIMQIPDVNINNDEFAVRWSGFLKPSVTGTASIGVITTDSYRLFIDDKLLIDAWDTNHKLPIQVKYSFSKEKDYPLVIEYKKHKGGGRSARLCWSFVEDDLSKAVEIAKKADVAVVALGESKDLSGESRDRSDFQLTGRQEELIRRVYETGTPVIAVLLNGRPLTINWINDNIPAVLEAWYPGDQGGTAIAEIIFGKCNPSGKLPVSFPKSIGQLPIYYDRPEAGRRRYVDGDSNPLYCFGDGLSYTRFEYQNMKITPEKAKIDDKITVSVDVLNTGHYDGYESVMLFINDVISSVVTPDIQLKDFKKIFLKSGEIKTVKFELGFDSLKLLDRNMVERVEPGKFEIFVGGNTKNTLKKDLMIL